jgi:hypothetical protein
MSTKQRVFKKLAEADKVELATQKVELGAIDDLIFSAKTAKAEIEEAVSFLKKADPLVQGASNRLNNYNTWIDGTLNEFKKINKLSNDLGVKPSSIDGYTEAEKFLSKAKQLKSTYDAVLKMIKSSR